jgi:hypothetical protein
MAVLLLCMGVAGCERKIEFLSLSVLVSKLLQNTTASLNINHKLN